MILSQLLFEGTFILHSLHWKTRVQIVTSACMYMHARKGVCGCCQHSVRCCV